MTSNQKVYSDSKVVEEYANDSYIQKAEHELLLRNINKLRDFNFLDIGFGAGRTTKFLIPHVKHYTGVDYSAAMVSHSKKIFQSYLHAEFLLADAKDLSVVKNDFYDVVLFSFNGIDCSDHDGRIKIISEIFKKCKSGGKFIFSFHNSNNLKKLYSFQFPKNPFKYLIEYQRVSKIKKINGPISQYLDKEYFSLYDGADSFQTLYYYIKPTLQISLLQDVGFKVERMLEATTGYELSLESVDNSRHPWIYLECVKP